MDTTRPQEQPTETSPDLGTITAVELLVSQAAHWIEEGVHILRSTEFDVIAAHEEFDRAVDLFVEKAQDLYDYLAEKEGISDNEAETFLLLHSRLFPIYKALERRELEREEKQRRVRLITVNLKRRNRRGAHLRTWRPHSTPASASQLLNA